MTDMMASSSASPFSVVDDDAASSISTVHPDIIHSHILNRLDGPTLASAACASSQLRRLCSEENIWRGICTAAWPSLEDPLVRDVISTFPGGYRSIFSDSFPALYHSSHEKHLERSVPGAGFISAIDIYYEDKPIFSQVQRMETQTGAFLSSPLWVDVLDPKELVPTPAKHVPKDEEWLKHLEESMSLSWILIDPIRKRSANLSSRRPVSVERHWLTRDLELLYTVVMAGDQRSSSKFVQCTIKVTCYGKVGGEMHVREVSMSIEDLDGRHISGRESVSLLQRAMENGKRKKVNDEESKARFVEFLSMKRERRERKHRTQKAFDMVSIIIAIIVVVFFCWFKL